MIEYSIYLNFLYIRNFRQYLIKFVLSLLERNTILANALYIT